MKRHSPPHQSLKLSYDCIYLVNADSSCEDFLYLSIKEYRNHFWIKYSYKEYLHCPYLTSANVKLTFKGAFCCYPTGMIDARSSFNVNHTHLPNTQFIEPDVFKYTMLVLKTSSNIRYVYRWEAWHIQSRESRRCALLPNLKKSYPFILITSV